MFKIFKNGALVLFIMAFFSGICEAEEYTKLNDLVEKGKELDGKKVTVQGEVIKEAMKRDDFAWININDTTNAMGIWIKKEDVDNIKVFGDYKHKGDIVQIKGIFNRSCKEHGGDMDIHSIDLEVINEGYQLKEEIKQNKKIASAILSAITLMVLGFYYRVRKI